MSDLNFAASDTAESLYLHANGKRFEMPALWLRERSPDPQQLDALTQQRLFDSHAMDPLITIRHLAAEGDLLWLAFSDGHQARYQTQALLSELVEPSPFPSTKAWGSELDILPGAGHINTRSGHRQWEEGLLHLAKLGSSQGLRVA